MAGKARFISGVFRAFAMARENRAERLAIFFIFMLGRTQSASGLYG